MNKTFKSVSDIAKNITEDKEFHKQLDSELNNKSISKVLFLLRCQSNITQKEMASRLKCTQGTISKIEHSGDDKQKIEDLIGYAKALGMELSINFKKPMKIVDKVKYHAFEIKKHLDYLSKIANEKKDSDLLEGISKFFDESLLNIVYLVVKSASTLPKLRQKPGGTLKVHAPMEIQSSEKKLVVR